MMLRISCLHTAQGNMAVFETARRQLRLDDVMLRHRVRADLLAAVEAGRPLHGVLERTAAELDSLAGGADAVLLTCSTLGAAAALAAPRLAAPVLRVDQALAAESVRRGGIVLVLCATGTTIQPTRTLFEQAARAAGAAVEVRLVPGAWDRFRSGDQPGYLRLVAEAADLAAREGADVVVLAQASMAAAAHLCTLAEPLTSPAVGLRAALTAARAAAEASKPL